MTLLGNLAQGGAGGDGSSGGSGATGGLAQGGGIFNYAGTVTLTECSISGDQAIGGAGGNGSSGGSGGTGGFAQGGGIFSSGAEFYVYSDGSFTETPAAATVTGSNVSLLGDLAQAGAGGAGDGSGSGGAGGNATGGAIDNEADSTLSITGGLLSLNAAQGGAGGKGGSSGTGGDGGDGFGGRHLQRRPLRSVWRIAARRHAFPDQHDRRRQPRPGRRCLWWGY